MQRRQAQFTDDQIAALETKAAETGRPVAAILREAVEVWRASDERRRRIERAMSAVGGFRSGLQDGAEDHDEVFVQAIEARIGRR